METLMKFVDLFRHVDQHLKAIVEQCGNWSYAILFLIVFCETGLVVTPFLPGDSLLFAAGAIAALGSLDVYWLCGLLLVAAILGDAVNYLIGYKLGPKVFCKEGGRFLRKEYLDRTHQFYEKYGHKTIVLARFVPIVRTFAPFVAGIGRMSYRQFAFYNVLGALLWVPIFLFAGYWFGQREIVQKNFTYVILGIVFVSVLPAVFEIAKAKWGSGSKPETAGPLPQSHPH